MNALDVYKPEPLKWGRMPAALSGWEESLRADRFWGMLLDNVKASARVRDAIERSVVWLEMKRLPLPASRLDDAVQTMREAVFDCQQQMTLHGPSKSKTVARVQALREAWIASVGNLRAVVDRDMADLPPATWEGIDG